MSNINLIFITSVSSYVVCVDVIIWEYYTVLLLPGETLASRVAASQLHALGCPELVANSAKDYERIAIKLGNNAE